MVTKRRITATPTDEAYFSGCRIVSYLNGAAHPKATPVPVENQEIPSASRVLALTFTGALTVEGSVDALDEYVYAAAANEADVVACRVGPLPRSNSFHDAAKSSAAGKMLFFSGRHRLCEMVLNAEYIPDASCVDPIRLPMQCLRSRDGANVSVHVMQPNVLCVCLPDVRQKQLLRFDDHTIACVGPGRDGTEMTVFLDNNTVLLCALTPSNIMADPETQTPPSRQHRSSVFTQPRINAELEISRVVAIPHPEGQTAAPQQALWAGRSALWVTYKNGTVCAYWVLSERAADETTSSGSLQLELVLRASLPGAAAGSERSVFISPDSRSPSLHYCCTEEVAMYYGTFRLRCPLGSTTAPSMAQGVPSTHYRTPFGEDVMGIRHDTGRYHVLTQTRRGGAPLFVTTMPLLPPYGVSDAPPALCLQILHGPEDDLLGHCRQCESTLSAMTGGSIRTVPVAMRVLTQLMDLRRSVYALMRREQDLLGGQLQAGGSTPHRLLERLVRKYAEVSVYLLLLSVDAMDGVDAPLSEALGLAAAREAACGAQEAFRLFVQETFGALMPTEVEDWILWPTKATLCVDVLLAELGYSSEASLASILSEAPQMSPGLALLVLYVSYRADYVNGGSTVGAVDQQCQNHAAREEFLRGAGQPVEANVWAYASFAVDHSMNPCEENPDGRLAHILGPLVPHMALPPIAALLPAIVNGLVGVAAVDTAYLLAGVCMAQFGGGSLSPSLGVKLLFVALQTRAHSIVETVYQGCRGPVLERFALQALAMAVLQRRDVSPLCGLIDVGSPQARVVERTLQSCEEMKLREQVLLPFYVLMQQYTEGLHSCRTVSERAVNPTTSQRAHLVASHLRSLMPQGNDSYMLDTSPADVLEVVQPTRHTPQPPADAHWGNVSSCPLEGNPEEMADQVRRALDRCCGVPRDRAGYHALSSLLSPYQPPHHQGVGPVVLRPSTLLSSLDRGVTPSPSSAVVLDQTAPSFTVPFASAADESRVVPRSGFASTSQVCEAVLKRSGKACGRPRPCPYHDRRC